MIAINPESLGAPRYSKGILVDPGGRLLFVAGQVEIEATAVLAP